MKQKTTNTKQKTTTISVRIRKDQYDDLLKEVLELSRMRGEVVGFSVFLQIIVDEHLKRQGEIDERARKRLARDARRDG